MNASIIAVGSEMLGPVRLDTNSLFLTQHLNILGIEVIEKRIIGDDRARLAAAIQDSLALAQIVILSGGLGPTEDDITRDAAATALGVGQTLDPDVIAWIEQRFARLGRKMAGNNRRQANILNGAEILANPNGTAPGQWIVHNGHIVMLLPGPPREIQPMFVNVCMPKLRQLMPPMAIATRWYRVAGMGESDVDALLAPAYTKYENPVTTILAKPGDVEIHLRARADSSEEAERLCAELGTQIVELLGDRLYSMDGGTLDAAVGKLLVQRGETVSVAESATAGMLGARFTDSSGSSAWFVGGRIVYTKALKESLIGEFHEDPVSEEVAKRLAAAIARETGSTWGVSITGVAGPEGGTEENPVGTVWVGIARANGGVEARRLQLFGERARVRSMAAQSALDLLRKKLLSGLA